MSFRSTASVTLERQKNGDLRIVFDNENMSDLTIKRSGVPKEKIGSEARKLLAASLAECMCSSLISLLEWARVNTEGFQARVDVHTGEDEKRRLVVESLKLNVKLDLPKDGETIKRYKRVETLFKRGCLIGRSLENGIKIDYSIDVNHEKD